MHDDDDSMLQVKRAESALYNADIDWNFVLNLTVEFEAS